MIKLTIEGADILTKTVKRHGVNEGKCGMLYLPKQYISKKVYIIIEGEKEGELKEG